MHTDPVTMSCLVDASVTNLKAVVAAGDEYGSGMPSSVGSRLTETGGEMEALLSTVLTDEEMECQQDGKFKGSYIHVHVHVVPFADLPKYTKHCMKLKILVFGPCLRNLKVTSCVEFK